MSDLCSAIAILKIVYGEPIIVNKKPNEYDQEAFNEWKSNLQELFSAMMKNFNKHFKAIDRKKDTLKVRRNHPSLFASTTKRLHSR